MNFKRKSSSNLQKILDGISDDVIASHKKFLKELNVEVFGKLDILHQELIDNRKFFEKLNRASEKNSKRLDRVEDELPHFT